MTGSEILFVLSTIFWCQALELRTLFFYAAAVSVTAVGKWLWLSFYLGR
jgi:hypothetical protein